MFVLNKNKTNIQKEPTNEPIISRLFSMNRDNSSSVKIFIPKDSKGNTTLSKYWYVYCYFRNPKTNKMDYKYIIKAGINRKKTIKERKQRAKELQRALVYMIEVNNFTPFNINNKKFEKLDIFVLDALKKAYDIKKNVWSAKTLTSAKSIYFAFVDFIMDNDLQIKLISQINKRHISEYLNLIIKSGKSPKTRNNHKAIISSLFAQLVNDEYLDANIVDNIIKLKTTPKKNIPFTDKQLKEIKNYLIINDPYLYKYIQFIGYSFLRPIEVNRLKIKDIDVIGKIVRVKSKTGYQNVYLIDSLIAIINEFKINDYPKEYVLFTPKLKPDLWNAKESNRQNYFMKRFRKTKKHFNLSNDYSLYSFRHSFALNLYKNFIKNSLTPLQAKHKLMTITRHKSLSGLENYLRDIGAILPVDYSNEFSFDF